MSRDRSYNKGKDNPMFGRHHSEKTKKKISEKGKGKNNSCYGRTGIKNPMYKVDRKGNKNPNWKGGMSEKYQQSKTERDWDKTRRVCYKRDNYKCQFCFTCKSELVAHHIIPWRISQNDNLDNLVTLCHNCHRRIEAIFNKAFNALYKPKIDEGKLIEILKPDEYNFIEGGTNLRGEHFIYLDIKKLAHAIAQKAEQILK